MKCENTFAVAARAELLKLQCAHGSPGDLVRMQSQPACASASPTSSRETRVPLAMDQVPQSGQQSKARASPNAMLTGSPVTIRKKLRKYGLNFVIPRGLMILARGIYHSAHQEPSPISDVEHPFIYLLGIGMSRHFLLFLLLSIFKRNLPKRN